MIAFIADANERIGAGHIMRCLSIADAVIAAGGEPPLFICARGADMIRNRGYKAIARPGKPEDLTAEQIIPYIKEKNITVLVTDSYYADAAYYGKLNGIVKTVSMFDLGDSSIECDILIDYNINYFDFSFPNVKTALLGTEHAPLRADFAGLAPKKINEEVKRAVITAGGSDTFNITEKILLCLLNREEFAGMEFYPVLGKLNVWKESISALAKRFPKRVRPQIDAYNMAEIIYGADVVLSAGGSTVYEICACGTPMALFSIAGNQDRLIDALESAGAALSAGYYRRETEDVSPVADCLLCLKNDRALRKAQSQKMRKITDGRGAERIARVLLS